ncbi:hypothetical protein HPB47_015074 [Ixodes persulcatus]|uniref:Uncharacterized protein n=1 Tax=Ixodes persulcatus TaxID=34615 RepID=A0AC60QWB8_IXOPE|nr:hypothetical protein HPB47_015074 [Ixodes persulcatus]
MKYSGSLRLMKSPEVWALRGESVGAEGERRVRGHVTGGRRRSHDLARDSACYVRLKLGRNIGAGLPGLAHGEPRSGPPARSGARPVEIASPGHMTWAMTIPGWFRCETRAVIARDSQPTQRWRGKGDPQPWTRTPTMSSERRATTRVGVPGLPALNDGQPGEEGWTKPNPATTTERKSTSVATNRHRSGTDQHLDMDEEGRRRSERNRIRHTAAAGPPDFQQPLQLEQEARALAVATTQPRAKMSWQVKIRNASTPTPWRNEYSWQAQQAFRRKSSLGCMDGEMTCLGFGLLYRRLYKSPCEERSRAWLTCFVPHPSTRTTQDHLQSPLASPVINLSFIFVQFLLQPHGTTDITSVDGFRHALEANDESRSAAITQLVPTPSCNITIDSSPRKHQV